MSDPILSHIQHKYEEFNNRYFKGELPQIPIRWKKLKRASAVVEFTAATVKGKKTYIPNTMVMSFDTTYVRTKEEYEPILLHEMIHVYDVAIRNDVIANHGAQFLAKRRELSARTGIDIPLTDNISGLQLKNETVKPVAVVARIRNDGLYAFALLSVNTATAKVGEIVKSWSNDTRNHVQVMVVTSPIWSRKALQVPIQRNVNYKMKWFKMTQEEYDDARKNANVLWDNQPT